MSILCDNFLQVRGSSRGTSLSRGQNWVPSNRPCNSKVFLIHCAAAVLDRTELLSLWPSVKFRLILVPLPMEGWGEGREGMLGTLVLAVGLAGWIELLRLLERLELTAGGVNEVPLAVVISNKEVLAM